MRTFPETDFADSTGSTPMNPSAWTDRTASDGAGLLLELARAERGFRFYAEADPRRRDLAERAHRALQTDLARAGDIDLHLDPDGSGLRIAGTPTIEQSAPLRDFEHTLRQHGIDRLTLTPELTRTALAGLLELLGPGASAATEAADFARTLAARDTRGIRINGLSDAAESEAPERLASTLPHARPSIARTAARERNPSPPTEPPSLAAAPLEAPAVDASDERLRARLIELEATANDAQYRARVRDVVAWAMELWQSEQRTGFYRALLVLADHAVGIGGRSILQARAAERGFGELAAGERLAFLIDRAAEPGSAGVRAAQRLLQLGDVAVPMILSRLAREDDEVRHETLRGLLLTQGEAALPALVAAIEGPDLEAARMAIRLAGELQNPIVLPVLIDAFRVPDLSYRLEILRALGYLPGEAATAALHEALTSDLEAIAVAAGEALAKSDGIEAVPTLLEVLESSLHDTRTQLGCTLITLLGRLGDERAIPRLCALLERRPVVRRAHWHALQLAAVDALAVLPTKEARRCIERAARDGAQSIRARAADVLQAASTAGPAD